jgi:hypothetical protein
MAKEKEKKDVDISGPKAQKARSNYEGQEHESLRPEKPESALAEKVRDAVEDPDCLKRAKKARFASTGEPSAAPTLDDVVKERAVTATGKDSKSSKQKK